MNQYENHVQGKRMEIYSYVHGRISNHGDYNEI